MQEPTTPGGEPQWITPIEMARMLAIGKTKAYGILANNTDIETIRLGRAIRINRGSLTRWIDCQGRSRGERPGGGVEADLAGRTIPNSTAAKRPLEILLNPKDTDYEHKVEAFLVAFGEKYASVERVFPEMALLKIYPGGAKELKKH